MSGDGRSASRVAAGELLNVTVGQRVEVVDRWTGDVFWRGTVESIREQNGQISVTRHAGHRRHYFSRFGLSLGGGSITWRLRVAT